MDILQRAIDQANLIKKYKEKMLSDKKRQYKLRLKLENKLLDMQDEKMQDQNTHLDYT